MIDNEILKSEMDDTTCLNRENENAKAIKPCSPKPEFLDFDSNKAPCMTVSKTNAINNKFIITAGGDDHNMFSYEDFVSHDMIIIKSCTGTGKTTLTAHDYKRLSKTSKGLRFPSIVDKIS